VRLAQDERFWVSIEMRTLDFGRYATFAQNEEFVSIACGHAVHIHDESPETKPRA
jgi:hypothetical protein